MSHAPCQHSPALVWVRLNFLIATLGLSSCQLFRQPPPEPPVDEKKPKPLYEWNEEAAAKTKGAVSVQIIIDDQKAMIYKGKQLIGWTTVASGIHKYPTPVGRFKVLEKVVNKKSNLYGRIYDKDGKVVFADARMGREEVPEGGRFEGAKMTYWMRVTPDGIGMHVGPIPHPGRRASHGCIRLPSVMARHLFETVSMGTPVTIIGDPEPPPVFDKPAKAKPESTPPASAPPTTPAAPTNPPPAVITPPEKPTVPAPAPAPPAQQ